TNADCTTKNITAVDTSGDIGKYTSIALDSSGFALISYQDETNDDLKFARCLNDACSSFAITTVDSAGDVGSLKTAVAIAPDGFARISYFDDTNDDIKFAQCTNANCTAKVITTVESSGNIGKYQAMRLGSDGFARIAYYGDGDVHVARCSDNSCTTKTISAPDSSGSDIGHYNSLAMGGDGFGRISHYDNANGDLRFIVCLDDACSSANPQIDAAQSFQPTINGSISQIELYLKKIGAPANATMRLIRDSAGSPSTNPADVLATAVINASTIGVSYAWATLPLSANPSLTANTTYWIVIDASLDNANYIAWGFDSGSGYTRGSPKRTVDWTTGGWINVQGDFNFRVYMGGNFPPLKDVTVGGKAHAHIMDGVTVGGNADTFTLMSGIIAGNINANAITDCTVGGNASYNSMSNCAIIGSQTTPTTPLADLPSVPMPLSDAQIQEWKNAAAAGGTISGDVTVAGTLSLGPKKITGKLTVTNGSTLIVTGTLWIAGDVVFDNNSIIKLVSSYGAVSGVIISDAKIDVKNNSSVSGSGNPSSFMMVIAAKDSIGEEIINVDNNSQGIIYYANKGWIKFSNNATAKEAVAYGIRLDNNATLIYDSGLADARFSSGPSGGYNIQKWKEMQ
ncbi:MAG: choice-of-anchor R domain-containing protein, partial [Patescibacteria group bacterium]